MKTIGRYFVFLVFLLCTVEFLNASASSARNDEIPHGKTGKKSNNSTMKHQTAKKSTFFRLTATKLIVMILSVIFSGLFIYYFFMFYPILCKKERNYDVVEHSRDTTPSPNTEKN